MTTEATKHRQLTKFGLLAQKVSFFRIGVPTGVVRELHEFKRLFSEMQDDKRLGSIAFNYKDIAEMLIVYAAALNSGKRNFAADLMKKIEAKWKETDALINALCDKEER
jgi:hypothetical protein